jgi:hypothetical protein
MLFRRIFPLLDLSPVSSAFVHQLSEEEMQRLHSDIICVSATYNIKLKFKEDTIMVEKLEAYRAELEAKKATLLASGIDKAAIEASVELYREQLTAEATKVLNDEITTIESNISCINGLISRELEAANTIEAVPANDTVTE